MTQRTGAAWITCAAAGVLALSLALLPSMARPQSADLVLCDRLAADAADPDKPADVAGVAEIAPADIDCDQVLPDRGGRLAPRDV